MIRVIQYVFCTMFMLQSIQYTFSYYTSHRLTSWSSSISSSLLSKQYKTTGSLRAAKTKSKAKRVPDVIEIEDLFQDNWKLQNVITILKNGGMGVICTDTCYSFVTSINSVEGINRITKLKSILLNDDSMYQQKKPLTLLCSDIKMASHYSTYLNENWVFKLMKATLPGHFTYIMPSTNHLPKTVVEHNKHVKR